MASSKDDAKQRKLMDVAAPGKSAPSATSRPVIVTNRPMLRRDPMMAPAPDGLEKAGEHNTMIPISRVAKTIKVGSLEPAAGKAADVPKDAKTADIPISSQAANNVGQKIALEVGEEALASVEQLASEVPQAKDALIVPTNASDMLVSDATPVAASHKFEPQIKPVQSVPAASDKQPEADAAPEPKVDVPQPEATSVPHSDVPPAQSSVPEEDSTDDQLAPNRAVDEALAKQQQQEAARQAEVEKVVASKQYFLPIKNPAQKRGTRTAVLVLILVFLLALVWLDVILDAGLVHINGVHALTHFFAL